MGRALNWFAGIGCKKSELGSQSGDQPSYSEISKEIFIEMEDRMFQVAFGLSKVGDVWKIYS